MYKDIQKVYEFRRKRTKSNRFRGNSYYSIDHFCWDCFPHLRDPIIHNVFRGKMEYRNTYR